MTIEEARQHFEQIRRGTLEEDSRSLRAALKLLAEELNTKETHFILELLQNAEDNEYAGKQPELSLSIEADDPTRTPSANGCLVVLNNEVGFQVENVRSLCSVGQSTKKDRNQGYIGEKGIGFKSVFRVTDSPHIFSNGFQFRFQVPTESQGFGYILPHWVEAVPPVVNEGFTAILLPLQPGKRELIARQLSKIAPETILFLRKLKRLAVGDGRSISRDDGKGSLVTLHSNGEEYFYFVHSELFHKPQNLIEEKRTGISPREVTVAFPLKTPAACKGRIFAFLPTEFDSGLPFLVNADFILNSNRERVLEDRRWNQWLRDEIAPTFVKAFLLVLNEPEWKADAYRFLPLASDLTPGADFFATIIGSVQERLQVEQCVLTKTGDYVLPMQAHFAGPLASRILRDVPAERAKVALLHTDLERHWERLKPLGVQSLKFAQLFEACNDDAWLKSRDTEWWETLFELCAKCDVSTETVGSFPILRCLDGKCRPLSKGVFFYAENQPTPTGIPPNWPAAHLLEADLQKRLQQKPAVWAWLTRVAGLQQFSIQSYITGPLLDWMREQADEHAAERLVEATRFIATNLNSLDKQAQQTLRKKMPWLLADKRVLLPEARAGKGLVTPECIEGDSGWNWVFINGHDREHFWVLSDGYLEGRTDVEKHMIRKLMVTCGATDLPQPARLSQPGGQADWGCPRWLRDLTLGEPPQNLERKVAALERWIGRFTSDSFANVLMCDQDEGACPENGGTKVSELGFALRNRPWLRSTKGLVAPSIAFLDDADMREFLGNSGAYVSSKLDKELLGKFGVRLRLSAATLMDMLSKMRDSGTVDEAMVVRIYRRLQTQEFDASVFRAEPLIFLSHPSAQWMQTERVFWNDAGDVFDEYFGYAKLTYDNEDLRGFFTDKLGVRVEVPEQRLAEVWAQMSGADALAPDVVEKRLNMILPKLAAVTDTGEPPAWWPPLRQQLMVWTTAKRFEAPASVFAPDDTFAEEVFASTARIAWVPRSHVALRMNRLLRSLGCRSLAGSLRSRSANTVATLSTDKPRFFTPATKELLLCWVCAADGWNTKRQQLEQLLRTDEVQVSELRVEYWLDGDGTPVSSVEANAFWSSQDRQLCLRHDATPKAQQSAAATSIATQLGRPGKQGEDTVYRLLGLEALDARRELTERKWSLTPEQEGWLQSFGYRSEIVELSPAVANQNTRESRPALTPQTTPDGVAVATTQPPTPEAQADNKPSSDAQAAPPSPVPSQTDSDSARAAGQTSARQQAERGDTEQHTRSRENEVESVCLLKSPDAEVEFVNVTAHSRRSPRRERQQRETADSRAQGQHPLAGVSHWTKSETEEAAIQCIKRQFQKRADLREFNFLDRRKDNCGYDIHAAKPGRVIRIEIKAHLREAKSVFVTQKEWQESRHRNHLAADDKWELWNVENLALDAAKVRITRYSYLPEEARTRESGYWVDLNACHSESVQ